MGTNDNIFYRDKILFTACVLKTCLSVWELQIKGFEFFFPHTCLNKNKLKYKGKCQINHSLKLASCLDVKEGNLNSITIVLKTRNTIFLKNVGSTV